MTQRSCVALAALTLLVGALVTFVVAPAAAEEGTPAAGPKAFETPEALVEAMVAAASKNDDAALEASRARSRPT